MAVTEYQTKAGRRYLAALWMNGKRVAKRGGFVTKSAARNWLREKESQIKSGLRIDTDYLAVAEAYLNDAHDRLKYNTYIYKRSVLKKLTAHLDNPNISIGELDRQSIKEFLAGAKRHISAKAANKYRIEISALFNFAVREGLFAGPNPAAGLTPYAVTKNIKYIPPADDLAEVLRVADGWQRDFVLLLMHTAARISEIRKLRWEDVDFARGLITLWTSKRRGGDTEPRQQAMNDAAREILQLRFTDPERHRSHVFANPRTGRPFDRQSRDIKYLFHDLCAAAGVPAFTAHSIRHYIASALGDDRQDLRSVQQLLGHQNIKTTQIYLHELSVDRKMGDTVMQISNKIANRIANENENANKKSPDDGA